MTEPFDQKKWIQEHGMEGQEYRLVSAYVKTQHPNIGLALPLRQLQNPQLKKKILRMPLEKVARYADAVTMACSGQMDVSSPDPSWSMWNVTNFGNMAYLALHHPSTISREEYKKIFHQMRTAEKEQEGGKEEEEEQGTEGRNPSCQFL